MFWWHLAVCMLRSVRGRWYVCQDRPDWFVKRCSEYLDEFKDDEIDDVVTTTLLDARHEWRCRQRNRRN